MRFLVDTNAFIWFIDGDNNISPSALQSIENIDNDITLSIASLWEIAIKRSLKKLDFSPSFQQLYSDIEQIGISLLSIKQSHLEVLETLPYHHRDPFDRIIVAQAIAENLTIITKDGIMGLYDAKTLW